MRRVIYQPQQIQSQNKSQVISIEDITDISKYTLQKLLLENRNEGNNQHLLQDKNDKTPFIDFQNGLKLLEDKTIQLETAQKVANNNLKDLNNLANKYIQYNTPNNNTTNKY